MCFQVYFKPSHRYIERELESSAKDKGFHSVTHPSPSLQATLHLWGREQKDFIFGIILTYLFMTKWEECTSRALMIPFLAIHAKGGENIGQSNKWISYHLRDFENSRIELFVKRWFLVGRNVDYGKKGEFLKSFLWNDSLYASTCVFDLEIEI